MILRILIIDQDIALVQQCATALADLGHELELCQNFDELSVQLGTADLLVIGSLPNESGLDLFARSAKADPALAGVLLVDKVDRRIYSEAMRLGVSRICNRNIQAEEFRQAVAETCNHIGLREEVTRLKTIVPLYRYMERFLAARTEHDIYQSLIKAVTETAKAEAVSIMLYSATVNALQVVAYSGLTAEQVANAMVRPGERISGEVFVSEKPAILNAGQPPGEKFANLLQRKELSAAISFPILSQGRVIGVLNVSRRAGGEEYSEADLETLSILINQAMLALENLKAIQEREEDSRVRALMQQYVSPEVTSLIMTSRKDLLEIGRIQELTVLFADIRNFTGLVQNLPLAKLREFLNRFFEQFAEIVFSKQGMLDKFMGDGALVVFGAPVSLAAPNRAAVETAIAIMRVFEKLRAEWELEYQVFERVGLGVGISRGEVFLGNVGSSSRFDFTVIGTDVNIAQRLASETESGGILCTLPVAEELKDFSGIKQKQMTMYLRGLERQIAVCQLSSSVD